MISNTHDALVTVITGPSGAGKSTISRGLATELSSCADIDIEHINYMIVNGFKAVKSDEKNYLSFNKWDLDGVTIGILAENFINNDFQVIIHEHVNKELLSSIEKRVRITGKFLLLPSLETVIARDSSRGKHLTMGENMVARHYEYFLGNKWDDFITIDSTNQSINLTQNKIKEKLNQFTR